MAEEHADPAEEEEEVEKGEQAAALNRLTGGGAEKELNTDNGRRTNAGWKMAGTDD